MNMMNTKIERVNPEQIDETIMEEAGRLIAEGELVAFPTETVYGLGGDALHPEAARKIYAAKGRPSDNPLIVHIADFSDIERVAREVPEAARKLASAFWPGPLTMIVWKSNRISDVVIRHPSLRCERRERNSKKLPSRACFAPKSKTARPVRSNSRLRLVGQRLSAKRIP